MLDKPGEFHLELDQTACRTDATNSSRCQREVLGPRLIDSSTSRELRAARAVPRLSERPRSPNLENGRRVDNKRDNCRSLIGNPDESFLRESATQGARIRAAINITVNREKWNASRVEEQGTATFIAWKARRLFSSIVLIAERNYLQKRSLSVFERFALSAAEGRSLYPKGMGGKQKEKKDKESKHRPRSPSHLTSACIQVKAIVELGRCARTIEKE